MASLEHGMPSEVATGQESEFGLERPGMTATRFGTGKTITRVWSDRALGWYRLRPLMMDASGNGRAKWDALVRNTAHGSVPFWFSEVLPGTHHDLLCGPVGDGSRTCFPMPILGSASEVMVLKAGVPQGSGYTLHQAANLLSDDKYCAPVATADWGVNYGSRNLSTHSHFGPWSMSVEPGGSTACVFYPGIGGAEKVDVTPGDDITIMASVFDTKSGGRNFKFNALWYDGGGLANGTTYGGLMATTEGEWTILSATITATAGSAQAYFTLDDQTTDTSFFYVDAWAVAPGSYDRIHLPSLAPNVIEYTTAPAANVRTTSNATGVRLVRGRLDRDVQALSMLSPGHATPGTLEIMEEPE